MQNRQRRKRWRGGAVAALVGVLAMLPGARAAQAATPLTLQQWVDEEAKWILSMYNGEVITTNNPDKNFLSPYHSNYGAIGLARAFTLTGNVAYSQVAWKWLQWYAAHMLADGTIPDFIKSGSWIPKGAPDSTDSYAGTYLSACLEVFDATADLQSLQSLHVAFGKAIGAIELTEDKTYAADHLHFARPGWFFKYSMDESEAYSGFLAAAKLGQILDDAAMTARATSDAASLLAASSHLVTASGGMVGTDAVAPGSYVWAVDDHGAQTLAPNAWIYPGASAQMWAVAAGLSTGEDARRLVDAVDAAQKSWAHPRNLTRWYPGDPDCPNNALCPVQYWPRFSLAHIAVGDYAEALSTATSIRNEAIANHRIMPYTPGDAGQIIMVMTDPHVLAASLGVTLPA